MREDERERSEDRNLEKGGEWECNRGGEPWSDLHSIYTMWIIDWPLASLCVCVCVLQKSTVVAFSFSICWRRVRMRQKRKNGTDWGTHTNTDRSSSKATPLFYVSRWFLLRPDEACVVSVRTHPMSNLGDGCSQCVSWVFSLRIPPVYLCNIWTSQTENRRY